MSSLSNSNNWEEQILAGPFGHNLLPKRNAWISSAIPIGTPVVLRRIPEGHWILCVQYDAGDIELSPGGRVTKSEREDPRLTAQREIEEEMGIRVDLGNIRQVHKVKKSNGMDFYYQISVDNCVPLKEEPEADLAEEMYPRKKNKVHVFIHGNLKKLLYLVQKLRYRRVCSDNPYGLALVPVSQAKICTEYRRVCQDKDKRWPIVKRGHSLGFFRFSVRSALEKVPVPTQTA